MDRRVKERLIGASILVTLAVLVVPELLSGPKPEVPAMHLPAAAPEPIRNVTVDLATNKAPAEPETSTPVTDLPASAPAPLPQVQTPPPSANIAAAPHVETQAPSPISSKAGSWAVQLGSFANRANADNLVHQLKAQAMPVYILSSGSGTSARYRVRVGPLPDRQAADKTAVKLKALGHASSVVTPNS
jgi:DedD protein